MKSQPLASHPFLNPWKSRKTRDSHIPTASATVPLYKAGTKTPGPKTSTKGVGRNKRPKWAKYSCQTHAPCDTTVQGLRAREKKPLGDQRSAFSLRRGILL